MKTALMLLLLVSPIAAVAADKPSLDESLVLRAVAYQPKFIRETKDRIEILEAALDKPTRNQQLRRKIKEEVDRLEVSQFNKTQEARRPIGDLIEAEIADLKKQIKAVQDNQLAVLPMFRQTINPDQWGVGQLGMSVERTDGETAFIGQINYTKTHLVCDGWEHHDKTNLGISGGMYVAGTRNDKFTRNVPLPIIRRFDPDELKTAVIASRDAAEKARKEKAKRDQNAQAEPKKN